MVEISQTPEHAKRDWRQDGAAVAVVLAVYLLFLTIVPPTGEFPTIDDFDYAATSWHLAETGQLRFSDWPAMTLVGHVLWGGLFSAVGGSSFLTLRLSMFVLSAMTALAIYAWSRQCGHSRALSTWFAVTFAVNPLTVFLEYTFMTDLSGVAFAAFLLVFAPRFETASHRQCLGYGTLAAVAYLTRETAVIPYLAYCGLALLQVCRRKQLVYRLVYLAAPFAASVIGFYVWQHQLHGVPYNREHSMLNVRSVSLHVDRLYQIVAMLALRMLPLSVLLATRRSALNDRRAWGVATLLVATAVGTTWLICGSIPSVEGADLFDTGMRQTELPQYDVQSVLGGPKLTWNERETSLFRLLANGATLFSMVVFCQWAVSNVKRVTLGEERLRRRVLIASLSLMATLSLVLFVEVYYSRYTLPLLLLVMAGVAAALAVDQSFRPSAAAWVTTGLVGIMSLFGIQDGMERSKAFWSAIDQVHQRGIEPSFVDAGMAYVGFYRYNPQYRGEKNLGPFLSDLPGMVPPDVYEQAMADISPATIIGDRPILVSFREEPGYVVLDTKAYRSWFRSGEVFILLRMTRGTVGFSGEIRQWIRESETQ